MLLNYVDRNTPSGGRSSVQLIAEKGKESFYIKKGFKMIPHEFCGSGMRKIIRNCVSAGLFALILTAIGFAQKEK